MFVPGPEVKPVDLKPGQASLIRRDFYTGAARPEKVPYVLHERGQSSEYGEVISRRTIPDDYAEPQRPIVQSQHTGGEGGGTAHWRSEASVANSLPPHRAKPSPRFRPGCKEKDALGGPDDATSYHEEFGRYGTNPRDMLGVASDQLPVVQRKIDLGTTKGTCHLPGYQGFVPACEAARSRRESLTARSTDKTNIEQIYRANPAGYAGHEPTSMVNAKADGMRAAGASVYSRDFVRALDPY